MSIIEYAYAQYTNKLRTKDNLNELLDISIALYPNQFEYYAYKGDLVPTSEFEKKVTYYKKAVQLNPQFQLYNVIYEIYFINNAYDSTIVWTQKTTEQFEYRPEPYLIQAYAHFRLDQFKNSVESANNGLEFIIDNNSGKIPYLSIIGTSYNSLKKYKESDKAFEKILEIDPQNTQALNNYSYYLSVRNEKLELAEKMSLSAISKEPQSSTLLDTYGWIKYKQGNYKEALIQLQKAIDLTPQPSSDMFEHLGDCYLKLGNIPDALINWKKALELSTAEESERLQQKIKSNE